MTDRPLVAFFRPADQRAEYGREVLQDLAAKPLHDPMLEIVDGCQMPSDDADVYVVTSVTGVEILSRRDWTPTDGATVAAIGAQTAEALGAADYDVDFVPEEYSSRGLVEALADDVDGQSVEVLRSDQGSDVLLDGLEDAGADVREVVLYRLQRPEASGQSARFVSGGEVAGALFTSSLTVEHFFEAAAERGVEDAARARLSDTTVVGAIGEPTAETLREHDVAVDVVADEANFGKLAEAVVAELE